MHVWKLHANLFEQTNLNALPWLFGILVHFTLKENRKMNACARCWWKRIEIKKIAVQEKLCYTVRVQKKYGLEWWKWTNFIFIFFLLLVVSGVVKVKLGILMMNAIFRAKKNCVAGVCTTKCLSFYSFIIFIKLRMIIFYYFTHSINLEIFFVAFRSFFCCWPIFP